MGKIAPKQRTDPAELPVLHEYIVSSDGILLSPPEFTKKILLKLNQGILKKVYFAFSKMKAVYSQDVSEK